MERRILEKIRQGDEKAFKNIFDRYYTPLCRLANQILGDDALAEEIVDDAIFYLWEHREELVVTHTLYAYLARAVRNRCLNELNSLSHRAEHSFSVYISDDNIDFLDALFADESHPLGMLMEHELEEKLVHCISSLPEECRIVFEKSRFEQKKYEEIARELNISTNTVKYHIKNALAYLRAHLVDYLRMVFVYIWIE